MRDVVQSSLRYLKPRDANAIVTYILSRQTPGSGEPESSFSIIPEAEETADNKQAPLYPKGQSLYRKHCSRCHGKNGQAKHPYYPNLKDNRLVTARNPDNLLLMILQGGFQVTTNEHPYPYSMPPFAVLLSDQQITEIANYVRLNWEKRLVKPIQPDQVGSLR